MRSRSTVTGLGSVLALALMVQPASAQRVAEVQVSPATISLSAGQEAGAFATAYDANGNVLVGQRFRWTSSNPNVVRVEVDESSSDVATLVGVSPGVARVEARLGSNSGIAAVQVTGAGGAGAVPPAQPGAAGPATVLRIEPGNVLMLPAESRQLIPLFLTDDGSPAIPQPVNWNSLNPAIVNVSADGQVVAVAEGQGTVEATTSSGLRALAPVRVTSAEFGFATPVLSLSPGSQATLQVIVPSQSNRTLPNAALSWRSTNESVVRVTPLGVATAVGPGQAEIVASGFLRETSLRVTVHRPVTELSVRPGPGRGPVPTPLGGIVQFEVEALAEDGTAVPEAPFVWTVRDTSVATFDSENRILHGKRIGETELHLRGPGPDILEATWTVNVIAGGLLVTPARVGIGVRDTVSIQAQFTDQEGIPLSPATNVTWRSADPGVAAVTGSGTVTGVGMGRARIVAATPWEAGDTAEVFVQGDLLLTATREGSPDLYAVPSTSPSMMMRITTDPEVEGAGAYSPDGSQIVFVSNREGGNFDVFVANADGSDPVRLTRTDVAEDAPVWTPDGEQIAYTVQAAGDRPQVWIMNADGTNPRQLTQPPGANFGPAISPDGTTIAFTSTRDGNYEIYLMGLDGSDQRNVTQAAIKESHPAWFPDGQLGYVEERPGGPAGITAVVKRRDLQTNAVATVTGDDLIVTDFAVAPSGRRLALEVSALAATGISRRVVVLNTAGQGITEIPKAIPQEQHSSPSFRPAPR